MRRFAIKNIVVATISLTLIATLSGCGAGPNAATRLINQVTDGAEAKVRSADSDLMIANFLLVATEDGSAVVVGTIINRAPREDALLGIKVGDAIATITGQQNLPQNQPIRFEGDVATSKAVFTGVNAEAGKNVSVTLAFAVAGEVKLNAIIRDKRDDYANITTGGKLATDAATE